MDFMKDFGETSALMLTLASPRASEVEVQLRAQRIAAAMRNGRRQANMAGERATLIGCFPYSLDDRELSAIGKALGEWAELRGADGW